MKAKYCNISQYTEKNIAIYRNTFCLYRDTPTVIIHASIHYNLQRLNQSTPTSCDVGRLLDKFLIFSQMRTLNLPPLKPWKWGAPDIREE